MKRDISGENNPMKNILWAKKQGLKISGENNPMKDKETREKLSKSWKNRWKNKRYECINNIKSGMTDDVKKQISSQKIKNWKNKDFRQKVYAGWNATLNGKMNKTEQKLFNVIKEYGFVFTGDFSFILSGKNPDFVNFETKQIIELFGDIFHTRQEAGERINHMKNNGYECLIIWSDEINKNLSKTTKKIIEYINQKELK